MVKRANLHLVTQVLPTDYIKSSNNHRYTGNGELEIIVKYSQTLTSNGNLDKWTSNTYSLVEFPLLRDSRSSTPLSLRCLGKSSGSCSWRQGLRPFKLLRTVGGELSELWSLRGMHTSSPESLLSEVFFPSLDETGDEGPGEGIGDGTGEARMREYRGEHVEKLLNSLERFLNSSSSSSSSSVSTSWL